MAWLTSLIYARTRLPTPEVRLFVNVMLFFFNLQVPIGHKTVVHSEFHSTFRRPGMFSMDAHGLLAPGARLDTLFYE